MDDSEFDVIVAGGGMVGSLLAAALASPGAGPESDGQRDSSGPALKVCVLEAAEPEPFEPGSSPDYDIRVSALSVASERMFRHVGAWDGVLRRRAAPFERMRVWDGSADEREGTTFEAADVGVEALGHIVENRVIQLALLERLRELPGITLACPATLERHVLAPRGDHVEVTLSDGRTLRTALLVGADGPRSTVRRQAGIECPREPYDQRAMVATVRTALPQQVITWQRFMPTGPQAMLPLCGSQASLVWYHSDEEIERLSALEDSAFLDELHRAFPAALGTIEHVHQRSSFPIAKAHAERYIASRIALIGDAAHTVHPLAGQGVNLGMLDAGALAQIIRQERGLGRDIGSSRVLRGYERWRRPENALMVEILDGFHRAFQPMAPPLQRVRALALDIADRAGPAKHLVSRYAMGLAGDLPLIAR